MIIFDISGRKIRQWSYQNQSAGTYEITWNGKDQIGNPVPSGVYIYGIEAGEYVHSQKMVLIK
jgi:flagellar hook assembly protein FlgD